ncbi:MAG: hypothetical protein E7K19_21900 [Escherichia coli]|nr:hypothetical protein [Escherichia coli]
MTNPTQSIFLLKYSYYSHTTSSSKTLRSFEYPLSDNKYEYFCLLLVLNPNSFHFFITVSTLEDTSISKDILLLSFSISISLSSSISETTTSDDGVVLLSDDFTHIKGGAILSSPYFNKLVSITNSTNALVNTFATAPGFLVTKLNNKNVTKNIPVNSLAIAKFKKLNIFYILLDLVYL